MKRRHSVAVDVAAPEGDFQDVLFGTMGLILVVLIWALTQIGIPEVSKETFDAMAAELATAQDARSAAEDGAAQERAARAAAQAERDAERRRREDAEQAKARADAARERAEGDARRAAGELSPKPVSVVVVCDGTLSMKPVLLALQQLALSLAEVGSRLSPKFELAIVVYRSKGNGHVFPLTQITRTEQGRESAGMGAIRRFMEVKDVRAGVYNFPAGSEVGTPTGEFTTVSRMSALSGFADVEGGVREGLAMLRQRPADTRSVLILVGDVGTHELGDPDKIDAPDHASTERIREMVRGFTQSMPRSRVWSVFAGDNVEGLKHRSESVRFFESVAAAAGDRGQYTADLASLTAAAVEAVFGNPNGVMK